MAWFSQVPAWVIPLLQAYVIPDDASVLTGIEFGKLDDDVGAVTLSGSNLTATYPGLIPNYSLDPEVEPQTDGTQYNLKAKKAVGFYGIRTDILSFDETRINKWTFPIVRRKFGYLAISRDGIVLTHNPVDYENQIHASNTVMSLVLNYDDDFSIKNLFNDADRFCANQVDCYLYPTVVMRVAFLPIWEVWAVRFFQS